MDTTEDLAAVLETSWAGRVRANREQVERFREVPDGQDFYAPVTSLFRADPTRTDDPVLDVLLDLVRSGDTWLDVGAGAGRFALPLARALDRSGGSVIALDASRSMLEGLTEIAEDYAIENVRIVEARWPPGDPGSAAAFGADVALIAHVGYDIEAIGPFLTALEDAADRLCVAVLMERVPASAADPFWPPVHGEERVPLPAMPDVVEILGARGRRPSVVRVAIDPRRFESRDALAGFVRRQLWIDPEGPKEARFQAALDELAVRRRRWLDDQGPRPERRRDRDVGAAVGDEGLPPEAFLAGYSDEIRALAETLRSRRPAGRAPTRSSASGPAGGSSATTCPSEGAASTSRSSRPSRSTSTSASSTAIFMADPDRRLEGAHLRLKKVRFTTFEPGDVIPEQAMVDLDGGGGQTRGDVARGTFRASPRPRRQLRGGPRVEGDQPDHHRAADR